MRREKRDNKEIRTARVARSQKFLGLGHRPVRIMQRLRQVPRPRRPIVVGDAGPAWPSGAGGRVVSEKRFVIGAFNSTLDDHVVESETLAHRILMHRSADEKRLIAGFREFAWQRGRRIPFQIAHADQAACGRKLSGQK